MATAPKKSTRIDTLQLKPSEARIALQHAITNGVAVFLWGPPGIGKSQIMKQIADDIGYGFVDIRLSQMDPTDLRGIPYPTEENGEKTMRWAPPALLPTKGEKKLVLLDELNAAPPSIQAAAYQLVLDRKLGEYVLPEGCAILAAGNRETDKGATFKMATPLMNRFVHLEMKTDFEDWQTHALSKMFHKDVVGYLTFQKQELFEFEPSSASRGFPTPRSWEFVSKLLHKDPNLPEQPMYGLIAGAVGEGVAIKFIEYRKNVAQLPNPSDILSGKIKDLKSREISVMYALTTGLCYELKHGYDDAKSDKKKIKDWYGMCDNFLGFMMKNFQPELVILGARTALAIHKLPMEPAEMKSWDAFSDQYQDLILKA
jgi:hypothetical protein